MTTPSAVEQARQIEAALLRYRRDQSVDDARKDHEATEGLGGKAGADLVVPRLQCQERLIKAVSKVRQVRARLSKFIRVHRHTVGPDGGDRR